LSFDVPVFRREFKETYRFGDILAHALAREKELPKRVTGVPIALLYPETKQSRALPHARGALGIPRKFESSPI
jgi:hypothetical protein